MSHQKVESDNLLFALICRGGRDADEIWHEVEKLNYVFFKSNNDIAYQST